MRPPSWQIAQPPAGETGRAVQAARLEFAFGGLPMSLVVSVVLAGMTAVMLRAAASWLTLVGWFTCLASVNVVRLFYHRRYRLQRHRGRLSLDAAERWLLMGCFAGGVLWGSSALLFLPEAPEQQFFLAFVIAGVSAGAVASLSVAPRSAYAFVVPCVLLLAVRFVSAGDLLHAVMGVMTCFYVGVLALVAHRGHTQLTRMVVSQLKAQLSDERLRVAADAGGIGVWEWDLPTGELRWDERMHHIYRIEPNVDSNCRDVWRLRVDPTDLPRVEAELAAAVADQGHFKSEFRIFWPNGEQRHIKAAAQVLRGDDGGASRLVGIDLDITETKRLERIKSEFVSTVSHELRTPLTSIRGALGLIVNDAAGVVPDSVKSLLRIADRNAERLGVLVEDLLDAERLENGKLGFELQDQPLRPLIQQSLDANAPYAAQHRVALALASDVTEEIIARINGQRILQIMTNLLSNAVKFSPPGGCVSVAVVKAAVDRVRVSVRDQGPGVSAEFQMRIFTLFTQGDASDARPKGGTGLGLAISKSIVEHMGGVIGFESSEAGGATFFFEIPCRQAIATNVNASAQQVSV